MRTERDSIEFETPENIKLEYQLAGPGERFVAWVTDMILAIIVGVILLFVIAISFAVFAETMGKSLNDYFGLDQHRDAEQTMMFGFAIIILVQGLGGVAYFFCLELFMRGQTYGKRSTGIRVVKANGFGLDPTSIFIRSIFRLIDHIPAFWIVPLFNQRVQRFGDMAAGTVVVKDHVRELSSLKTNLLERGRESAKFRFSRRQLDRLGAKEVEVVSRLLERWSTIDTTKRESILATAMPKLLRVLEVEWVAGDDCHEFLSDLLSQYYQREERKLG